MRILLVDPSSRGGIVVYTKLIARALLAAGTEPEVLTSRTSPTPDETWRVHRWLPVTRWTRPARAGPRFFIGRAAAWAWSAAATAIAVGLRRPQVVHFQMPFNRRFDAFLIRGLRRAVPVVWTAHDVLPHEHTAEDVQRFRSIYRSVDAVIVHVGPAAESVAAMSGVHATVVPHPAPDIRVELSRDEARRRLDLPAEARILGALGFIRSYKGYDLLVDVWRRLGDSAPTLLVMGQPLGDEAARLLSKLQAIPSVVVREGFAREPDLVAAARACDALVLPYSAGSDSGVLHLARAVGTPVIASAAPELAASVQQAGAGVVVTRDTDAWSEAVTGNLPAPPAPPLPLETTGIAHREVYDAARARWAAHQER